MFIDSLTSFLQKINAESEIEEWYLSNFIEDKYKGYQQYISNRTSKE